MHFFLKNGCVFFHCACVLPRLLLPFGKNLDSKRTIYFEWPYQNYHFDNFWQLCVVSIFIATTQYAKPSQTDEAADDVLVLTEWY